MAKKTAKSERKFFRTVIEIEVLSEDPYAPEELSDVVHDITEGHCSGIWNVKSSETLDGPACAKALLAQASDPEFFQLTPEGADTDEYEPPQQDDPVPQGAPKEDRPGGSG